MGVKGPPIYYEGQRNTLGIQLSRYRSNILGAQNAACTSGNYSTARGLLDKGIQTCTKDNTRLAPSHLAVIKGTLRC